MRIAGSLFYCTSSDYNSPAANAIQTKAMANAFSKYFESIAMTVRSDCCSEIVCFKERCVDVYMIPHKRNRLAVFMYAFRALFLYFRLSQKRQFKFIFNRNMLFCLLACFLTKIPIAIELHTGPRSWVDKLILYLLAVRKVHLVCISNAIKMSLEEFLPDTSKIHVFHDGHNFPIVSRAADIKVTRKLRVGYFGSYTAQKGSSLIKEIVKAENDIDFYIYTKDIARLDCVEYLKDYGYIPHGDIQKKMNEMDVLLLTVVPQGSNDLISAYTSPLKLYEYLAVGKPIIASDVPALKEDVSDSVVFYSSNNAVDFLERINFIKENYTMALSRAERGLGIARSRTWDVRAKDITNACGIIE